MSFHLFQKAAFIWIIIAAFAIANGIFKESFLEPYLGKVIALPASGITLSIIIFSVILLSFRLIEGYRHVTYLYIGLQWVSMTLIFEFIFGHYIMERSWQELFQVFNIFEGNLFLLALLVTLFSPLLVFYIKK